MHHHYYTLYALARYLNQYWAGAMFIEAFSQHKDECVFQTTKGALRVGCATPLTYIVPVEQFSKAGKNVASLFARLSYKKFLRATTVQYERVLILECEEDYQLICKLHSIKPNILLRHQGQIIDIFQKAFQEDMQFEEKEGRFSPQETAQWGELTPILPEKELMEKLRTVSPIFDRHFVEPFRQLLHTYPSKQCLQPLISLVEAPKFYVYKDEKNIHFSLFPQENAQEFLDIQTALAFFLRVYFHFHYYIAAYAALKKEIEQPYKKRYGVYESFLKTVRQLEQERSAEELGHLLMANLHLVEIGSEKITVADFYHEDAPITLKLNKDLSPQENATHLYKKQKERKAKILYLSGEISKLETDILEMEAQLSLFQSLVPPPALLLHTNGLDTDAVGKLKASEKHLHAQQIAKTYPFRFYEFENWQIFVGKNGKNNDELLKFAHKNDVWLHAKDVAGSHVVIRQQAGQVLPHSVLEYAAGLAAWYSKLRMQSLVPVIHTQRKYVRKRKGDAAGKVAVSQERVVIVPPVRGSNE